MSTIRQLPSETLAEIFQWCLPLDVGFGVRSLGHAPLLLTIVCWDWRRIAIETPRLWNSLHICFPPNISTDIRSRRTAGMELWLQRSGSLPISISIHGGSVSPFRYPRSPPTLQEQQFEGGNDMVPLMKSFLSFRDRLQNIHLALNKTDLIAFHGLLASPDSSFPSLRSFKLEDYKVGTGILRGVQMGLNEDVEQRMRALLSQMPALQSLEIRKLKSRSDIQFRILHSRWDTLTNLSISTSLTPTDLFGIITKTRALQTLKVGIIVSALEHPFDVSALTPATLLNLVSLQLNIQVNVPRNTNASSLSREEADGERNRQLACSMAITSRIVCPGLKRLHTSWPNIITPVAQIPILNFPMHALETLGLDILMTPEALVDCLSLVPNLTSLHFVDVGNVFRNQGTSTLQDAHLRALTPSADNPFPLCPHLRHLFLIDHSSASVFSRSWSTHLLAEFITTRAKANMLSSCDLFFLNPFSLSDEELHTLRAAKQEARLKLRLHDQGQVTRQKLEDGPMDGLAYRNPAGRSRRRLWDLLDDHVEFDTRAII
ncbi:hypothetical protein D9757_007476 [Collybiopsis confluens]|uniref:F-box domain-containing protein n=1 Tax=Collybiopsis confluens TaxID=2823264 RepID=A0A8H5HJP2_9AGAR|nr:hypothetical protein D9757_007476 [Collybiopsis confluens]